MNIFFNGCSYTWGDELSNRYAERYSRVVCEALGAKSEINIAVNGRSNDAIARTTMKWFLSGNRCDLAVIQWTLISRFESFNEQQEEYVNLTVQQKEWKSFYADYYHDRIGVDHLWKNVVLLEQYFIKHNIPYVFLFHDRYSHWKKIPMTNAAGQKWDEFEETCIVLDTPCVWRELVVNKNFNFMRSEDKYNDLVILNGGKSDFNGGHPSPQGHKKIAQRILDCYNHYGK